MYPNNQLTLSSENQLSNDYQLSLSNEYQPSLSSEYEPSLSNEYQLSLSNENQLSLDDIINLKLNQFLSNQSSTNQLLTKKLKSINNQCNSIEIKLNQLIDNKNPNDQIKLESEFKFKLDWQLRNKLNIILNDFIFLLYSDTSDSNDEKLIEISNYLISNLVNLPLKLDDIQDNHTNSIDDNQTNSIDNNQDNQTNLMDHQYNQTNSIDDNHTNLMDDQDNRIKPILILDSKMRLEITDLLIKNKNYSILLKNKIDKDSKLNLINENTNMIFRLLKLPLQIIKADDSIDDSLIWKKNSNHKSDHKSDQKSDQKSDNKSDQKSDPKSDQIATNLESIGILELKKSIDELKKEISILKLSSNSIDNETNFLYELKKFSSFVDNNHTDNLHRTPLFKCLGLDWYLKLNQNGNFLDIRLIHMNKLEEYDKRVEVDCELEILNQRGCRNNIHTFIDQIFPNTFDKFDRTLSIDYLKANQFVMNDKLVLMLNMNANWI